MTQLAENPGNIVGWMTDHDGKLRLATTSDGVNTTILYRENEQEKFKPILTTSFKETMSPYLFTFDNKMLISGSNLGRDKTALVTFDPATEKKRMFCLKHRKPILKALIIPEKIKNYYRLPGQQILKRSIFLMLKLKP